MTLGNADGVETATLVPIGPDSQGPLRWSKRYGYTWAGWKRFKPITLSSNRGIHAVIEPAGDDWWEMTKRNGILILGYCVRTYKAEYIIQGSQTPTTWEKAKGHPVYGHTVVVTEKTSGSILAIVANDLCSVEFSDGGSFAMRFRNMIPFVRPHQYEFFDSMGTKQFRVDRKGAIWLEPGARDKHLLSLIIINRFLVDLITAEASGG